MFLIKKCDALLYMCEIWGTVTQPDVEAHKLGLIELFYCWVLF